MIRAFVFGVYLLMLSAAGAQPVVLNHDEKFIAGDGDAEDFFGVSIAGGEGNRVLIGAMYNDGQGEDTGAAYLFDSFLDSQLFKLEAPDAGEGDRFGNAVAMNNQTLAVGAYLHDGPMRDMGAVYLFDRDTGAFVTKLMPEWLSEDAEFGRSLAIDNDLLVVGAPVHDTNGIGNSGLALVYDISDPSSPELVTQLIPSDPGASDYFGFRVDIDGDLVGVTAINHETGTSFCNSGAAYLFDAVSGEQYARLIADDLECEAYFGYDIALNSEVMLVSSLQHEHVQYQEGAVFGFSIVQPRAPYQMYEVLGIDGVFGYVDDDFGESVAIDGPHGIIGHDEFSGDRGRASGAAYAINLYTGELVYQLVPSVSRAFDAMGRSVDVVNGRVYIGAIGDETNGRNAGAAYMFQVGVPGPCSFADRTVPYGVIDADDAYGIWIEFLTQSPTVDIAHPIGELNFYDFSLMLELYLRGCPD